MFSLFRAHRQNPRLQQLQRLSLFQDLSPAELAVIDLLMHERTYLAGEVIFDAGEEGYGIYVILSGTAAIYQPSSGKQIAALGVGSFFGELALLDDSRRMAQARAESDCVLAAMSRGEFMGLLETHAVVASKISLQLARHLGRRLRTVQEAASES